MMEGFCFVISITSLSTVDARKDDDDDDNDDKGETAVTYAYIGWQ
jgi:hypothetical protein